MDWPVLWDPFNVFDFKVVPVTYVLNPDGAVLVSQPSLDQADEIGRRILSSSETVGSRSQKGESPPIFGPELIERPPEGLRPGDRAAALALWGHDLDDAVDEARRAAELDIDPAALFRLGVTLRMRHDSPQRRAGDFADAVSSWSEALAADPNQYIWRRRLQQYGPRLSKPYPFYDWVLDARTEVEARGDEPVELAVEPRGAEFADLADPTVQHEKAPVASEPGSRALVAQDRKKLIGVETISIPPTAHPGESVRVHLILTPNEELDAHWNNEAGLGELWVDPPDGWRAEPRHQSLPPAASDVSEETRHIELELTVPEDARPPTEQIAGHLLYYVCEGRSGICLYRRQDIYLQIDIDAGISTRPLAG